MEARVGCAQDNHGHYDHQSLRLNGGPCGLYAVSSVYGLVKSIFKLNAAPLPHGEVPQILAWEAQIALCPAPGGSAVISEAAYVRALHWSSFLAV